MLAFRVQNKVKHDLPCVDRGLFPKLVGKFSDALNRGSEQGLSRPIVCGQRVNSKIVEKVKQKKF
jgi:hypothetical protein